MKKLILAVAIAIILVMGAFAYIEINVHQVPWKNNPIPLSNVTLDLSISPFVIPPTPAAALQSVNGNNSTGALVEVWPVYNPFSKSPAYMEFRNVSPMAMLWVNDSWHASFRILDYFFSILNDWRDYFGINSGGMTSLIFIISYFFPIIPPIQGFILRPHPSRTILLTSATAQ